MILSQQTPEIRVQQILEVQDLTKMFGGVKAQDQISFSIEKGIVCGLIGPNGAGKTTLFNMITGIYRPDAGKVLFNGKDIRKTPVHGLVKAGVARTFQHVELFSSMTLLENIMVACMYAPKQASGQPSPGCRP